MNDHSYDDRMEDEPDHPVAGRHTASRCGRPTVGKPPQDRAAGPDDELAQTARLVLAAGRILGSEPLVIVVVAVDDDIGAAR